MSVLGIVGVISLLLGLVKYGSLAGKYKGASWQLKFAELWNDTANFFFAGLVGYYFVLIRWPLLLGGAALEASDFALLVIFMMGSFGHLCVLSKNITDGVEVILKRVLER